MAVGTQRETRKKVAPFAGQALPTEVIMAGYRDEIRKLRSVLRDWHKFMNKLSKLLKCLGDHDTVVMRVDELVKRCPPRNGTGIEKKGRKNERSSG